VQLVFLCSFIRLCEAAFKALSDRR